MMGARATLTAILLSCVSVVICGNDATDLVVSNLMEVGGEDAEFVEDQDNENKPASFLIVIEHRDAWRCSGSLVSLRTALTSAWCARGRGPAPAADLWALAAAAVAAVSAPADHADHADEVTAARLHGARRIVRVAVAAGADAEVGEAPQWDGESWRGGALDLALVELERAFGGAARAVPILMASDAADCAPSPPMPPATATPPACHVARALSRPDRPRRRALLDIVSVQLQPPDKCAAAAKHWSSIKERALCLVGSELCESDWGAGVVCGGLVCGVVGRSVRGAGRGCGRTHAAQSIARWRRFLHCAHTLRACGSDGDCAELCVERRLVDEPSPPAPSVPPAPIEIVERTASHRPLPRTTASSRGRSVRPSRTRPATRPAPPAPPATRSPPPPLPALPAVALGPSSSLAMEFEPNRADFKATPARSSPVSVYLKAGEYGDNVADYGGGNDEMPVPTRTPSPANETFPPQPQPQPQPHPHPQPQPQPQLPPQPHPQPERRTAADAGTPTMPHRSTAQTRTISITLCCFVISVHLMRLFY